MYIHSQGQNNTHTCTATHTHRLIGGLGKVCLERGWVPPLPLLNELGHEVSQGYEKASQSRFHL